MKLESDRKRVFVISDLHLDHTNIISYCNRPFQSTEEMNRSIIKKWNETVRQDDVVYFLGDMSFGRESRKIDYWAGKLNGNITFIKGSHDRSKKIKFLDSFVLWHGDNKFLLIHDPENAPEKWNGWIIHGHCHNNDLKNYPFINGKKKTINVSVEVINYKPLDMDKLFELDFENIDIMETIDSPVRR